ncbi:MAG: DUF5320 domain-containing protein [Dehalococcoidaceae bacterium]|nr:DUF5320 domain-containing protein [Dehalococcoidaceae bacterium]
MPGFDRTGPAGMGSMTGGARGLCNPRGIGFRGVAPRHGWYGNPHRGYWPVAPVSTGKATLDTLKSQAATLRSELDALEREIDELSGSQK